MYEENVSCISYGVKGALNEINYEPSCIDQMYNQEAFGQNREMRSISPFRDLVFVQNERSPSPLEMRQHLYNEQSPLTITRNNQNGIGTYMQYHTPAAQAEAAQLSKDQDQYMVQESNQPKLINQATTNCYATFDQA